MKRPMLAATATEDYINKLPSHMVFQEKYGGKPRHPKFICFREDI